MTAWVSFYVQFMFTIMKEGGWISGQGTDWYSDLVMPGFVGCHGGKTLAFSCGVVIPLYLLHHLYPNLCASSSVLLSG